MTATKTEKERQKERKTTHYSETKKTLSEKLKDRDATNHNIVSVSSAILRGAYSELPYKLSHPV